MKFYKVRPTENEYSFRPKIDERPYQLPRIEALDVDELSFPCSKPWKPGKTASEAQKKSVSLLNPFRINSGGVLMKPSRACETQTRTAARCHKLQES